jgi:hypothetical protein
MLIGNQYFKSLLVTEKYDDTYICNFNQELTYPCNKLFIKKIGVEEIQHSSS